MKRFYYLFFVSIAVVCLAACKKDNNEAPSSIPKELLGKWHQVKERQVVIVEKEEPSVYENTNFAEGSYIQYNADGTATYNVNGQVKETYKFKVNDNMLTIMDINGQRIDADSQINVTATTLNLHQVISGKQDGKTFRGTVDFDFVRVD